MTLGVVFSPVNFLNVGDLRPYESDDTENHVKHGRVATMRCARVKIGILDNCGTDKQDQGHYYQCDWSGDTV